MRHKLGIDARGRSRALALAWLLVAWAGHGTPAMDCDTDVIRMRIRGDDFNLALSELKACSQAKEYPRLIGLAYHGLFYPDSAMIFLKSAYRSGFRDDEVLIALADAWLWQKNSREAVPLLNQVQDKSTPTYLKAMAARYEVQGDFTKALALYDRAIAMEKKPFIAQFRKAMLLSWMKRFDESIELYTYIMDINSVPIALKLRCRMQRAEVMSWKKDLPMAEREFRDVLRKDKRNVFARLRLGEVLEWQSRFKEAQDQYKEVLIIDPENQAAKKKLKDLLWVK
jgi:tetratricopeptide (TPR) repeat protein